MSSEVMMWTLVTILFSFILTGLIGNALAARWQHRNWIAQQKIELAQRRNSEQISLHEELERAASARRFHTLRLAYALMSDDEELIRIRLNEYDKTVVQWNERYPSFLSRLRIYSSFEAASRIENLIHTPLVASGNKLMKAKTMPLDQRINNIIENNIEQKLNDINGSIIAFSRDYLRELYKRASIIIDPDLAPFKRESVEFFSTMFLLKSLFRHRNKEELY